MEKEDIKNETIHYLNYYSKYYCRQLIDCENLFDCKKGHLALFNILALFENIMKSTLNDFDETFYNLNIRLKNENIINDLELRFLNDNEKGIRKLRNILAHANLSKYDLLIDDELVTFPLSENETCLILYERLSSIICRIILKLLNKSLIMNPPTDKDCEIENIDFTFITRTPEELMRFKGLDFNSEWEKLDESSKYRLVENSPDVNILSDIFKGLQL